MRHQVAGKKLSRTTAHKKAMFRNMVTSLILNDRIETTLPKAKELRRWADNMITLAKKNSLSARRQAMAVLQDRAALQKLFSTLVDRYKNRTGGYTRILKLGFRHGDNAAMAIVEYLTAEVKKVIQPGKNVRGEAAVEKKKKADVKTKGKTSKTPPKTGKVKKATAKKKTAKKSK